MTREFSDGPQWFADFLWEQAKGADDLRFVARNFLLDEGLAADRGTSYLSGVDSLDAFAEWEEHHISYLEGNVLLPRPASGAPKSFDPNDPSTCAETFRTPLLNLASALDLDLDLVRLVPVQRFSDVEFPVDDLVAAGVAYLKDPSNDAAREMLDDAFYSWSAEADLRPVFASLWRDVQHLESLAKDADDMVTRLRDKLGLAYLNPTLLGDPIHVFIFKYSVRSVPRIKGVARDQRTLLPPTVLDTILYPAFCPRPEPAHEGLVMNLRSDNELPIPEYVHPPRDMSAADVYAVGAVTSVPDLEIELARLSHFLSVRAMYGIPDLGKDTDGDLGL